ncbi:hypothetical protein PtA15_4A714 [Puccinia triticina]|uniref:Uncharacterized protein n=1 Tax=Puccinia triticina TaxID=208348 RepID=A0ABY7CGA5_9BASI|nr:uncharacterized protein PtA15_4A714 [Puccinia triticina]WAQ84261.1 hypothetical protein PtA15_4A714 [Puccinia triticina]
MTDKGCLFPLASLRLLSSGYGAGPTRREAPVSANRPVHATRRPGCTRLAPFTAQSGSEMFRGHMEAEEWINHQPDKKQYQRPAGQGKKTTPSGLETTPGPRYRCPAGRHDAAKPDTPQDSFDSLLALSLAFHQSSAAPMNTLTRSKAPRDSLTDAIAQSREYDAEILPNPTKKKSGWSKMIGFGSKNKSKSKDKQVLEVTQYREEVEHPAASLPPSNQGSPAREGERELSAEEAQGLEMVLYDGIAPSENASPAEQVAQGRDPNRRQRGAKGRGSNRGGQVPQGGSPGYNDYGAGTHDTPVSNYPALTYGESTHDSPGYAPLYDAYGQNSYNTPSYGTSSPDYSSIRNWGNPTSGGFQESYPEHSYANDQGYQNSQNNYRVVPPQSSPLPADIQQSMNLLDLNGHPNGQANWVKYYGHQADALWFSRNHQN